MSPPAPRHWPVLSQLRRIARVNGSTSGHVVLHFVVLSAQLIAAGHPVREVKARCKAPTTKIKRKINAAVLLFSHVFFLSMYLRSTEPRHERT